VTQPSCGATSVWMRPVGATTTGHGGWWTTWGVSSKTCHPTAVRPLAGDDQIGVLGAGDARAGPALLVREQTAARRGDGT
jgi:hypothetical protein